MTPFKKNDIFIVYAKAVACFLYIAFWLLFEYSKKYWILCTCMISLHACFCQNFDTVNTGLFHVDPNWLIKGRFIAKLPAARTEPGESYTKKTSTTIGSFLEDMSQFCGKWVLLSNLSLFYSINYLKYFIYFLFRNSHFHTPHSSLSLPPSFPL